MDKTKVVYTDSQYSSLADHTIQFLTDTGRLKSTVHPYAQSVMREDKRKGSLEEIKLICDVDESHLIMLLEGKILSLDDVAPILKEIQILRNHNFEPILRLPMPRGLYMTYESYMIAKLGNQIGGNLQLARSRNNINATINNLRIRDDLLELIQALWRLIASMTLLAKKYVNTSFPIYSQYQTALPGTFGHYLMAIVESLLEHINQLIILLDSSMKSPLGACSGGGTTLPIDPQVTADLLASKQNSEIQLMLLVTEI